MRTRTTARPGPARPPVARTLALLSTLALLGAVGCGSKMTDVYLDPSFDAEALEAGSISVFGVTSLPGPDDVQTRIGYRERVQVEMRREREGLDWVDPSAVWIGVGPERAQELLDAYRDSGRFTAEQLEQLAVVSDRVRYLIFARVDLDLTSYDYERQEREVGERWVLQVDPRARREMGVGFDVFDLERRTLVSTARLQRIESERGTTLETEMLERSPTEADFVRATRDLLAREELPPPPSRSDVLSTLAREAARALPGEGGGR